MKESELVNAKKPVWVKIPFDTGRRKTDVDYSLVIDSKKEDYGPPRPNASEYRYRSDFYIEASPEGDVDLIEHEPEDWDVFSNTDLEKATFEEPPSYVKQRLIDYIFEALK